VKKWILTLFIPSLVMAFGPTPEHSCSTIDLRNESLGKVRDQGDTSWCYAFSSADILQRTYDLKHQISATDIALLYNESTVGEVMDVFLNYGTPHQTGFAKVAMMKAMNNGYCPETVFPSENWIRVKEKKEVAVPVMQAFQEINKLHRIRKYLNLANLPYYYKFKNVDKKKFLFLIQTKKLKDVYSKLRTTVCKDNRISFDIKWKTKMVLRHKNIFWDLNEQLSLGRVVALDYDARILRDKNHKGYHLDWLHTSNILARRWNPEQASCEYLIRDSYGDQCLKYDPSYVCEGGQVWINENRIFRNMTSINYLLSPIQNIE
jgi:hypothetical protein